MSSIPPKAHARTLPLLLTAATTLLLAIPSPPAFAASTDAGGAIAPGASSVAAGTATSATGPASSTTTVGPASTTGATNSAAVSPTGSSAGSGLLGIARTGDRSKATTPARATGKGKLSGGAILAAVIAALLALACLAWGIFRWTAIEPRWTQPLRHSMAEAGFRASAFWAEFTDWIRLGH